MQFLVACLLIFGISIFTFETTIAGKIPSATSYYQGEPTIVKQEKKLRILKKKKSRKHRFDPGVFIPYAGRMETYGFTVTTQTLPTEVSISETSSKSNYLLNIQADPDRRPIPQKENPHPTPDIPTEFILPSILLFRKENNNQTMD